MTRFSLFFCISLLLPSAVYAALIHGRSGTGVEAITSSSGQLTITTLAGEDATLNQMRVGLAGTSCLISTATSTECVDDTAAHEVIGFYVASTSAGTVRFYDDDDGTCSSTDRSGVITPAVGWHFFPATFSNAICVLTSGTITVNVIYR